MNWDLFWTDKWLGLPADTITQGRPGSSPWVEMSAGHPCQLSLLHQMHWNLVKGCFFQCGNSVKFSSWMTHGFRSFSGLSWDFLRQNSIRGALEYEIKVLDLHDGFSPVQQMEIEDGSSVSCGLTATVPPYCRACARGWCTAVVSSRQCQSVNDSGKQLVVFAGARTGAGRWSGAP